MLYKIGSCQCASFSAKSGNQCVIFVCVSISVLSHSLDFSVFHTSPVKSFQRMWISDYRLTTVRSQASIEADQPSTDCRTGFKGTRHSFS